MFLLNYDHSRNRNLKVLSFETSSFSILFYSCINNNRLFFRIPIQFIAFFATFNEIVEHLLQEFTFRSCDNEEQFERWISQKSMSCFWVKCWICLSAIRVVHKEHIGAVTKTIVYCLLLVKVLYPIEILNKNWCEVHINSTEMLEESKTNQIR